MTSPTPTVAFLGTGTMGAPMVRRLRAADLPVRAWNRSRGRAEALADTGATVAGSPAEAADGADVVVTMLFDADAVLESVRSASPARGTVWLQMSTVGVEGAARTVELARELGLVLVDAPVLGTRKPAEDGALVVLASGPEEARERVAPVLDAVGSRTLWLGEEPGLGSRLKLVCNAWVLSVTAGVAQSVAMAEGLGVDPQAFLEAIEGGASDTPYAHAKGANMLAREYPLSFSLAGARKDAGLIVEALAAAGVPDRHTAAVAQSMDEAVARGTDADAVDLGALVEGLRR
jgi:3-hydroxyisobutyrate dehydrogenase